MLNFQTTLIEHRPLVDERENSQIVLVTHFSNDYCCHDGNGHRHPFYELHWLAEGGATYVCDTYQFDVLGPALVFVSPGQVHSWAIEDFQCLSVFTFTPELFSRHGSDLGLILRDLPFHRTDNPPIVPILADTASLFQQIFTTAHLRQQDNCDEGLLLAYLNVILAEAKHHFQPTVSSIDYSAAGRLTQSFRFLVEQHYLKRWQVQQYADLLGVTSNYLVETVRQATGTTPGRMVQDRLLLEAERLLIHTRLTVAEIADLLSFTTLSYFGRWFKNLTSSSPTQFREQYVARFDP